MIGDIAGKDKWYSERHGKFTASCIYKLLSKGAGVELFGQGAKTYIKQKAIEKQTTFWENPKMEFVKPILWGKRYEQPGFDHYITETRNTSMRYFGTDEPIFLTWDDRPEDAGGSPDGIAGEELDIYWGLELKCPENSSVHWDYLQLKDQTDLRGYCPEYYAQIQNLLMITKAKGWDFCSFDERFKEKSKRMKIIEVRKDNNYQNNLETRILQAIKERDKLIAF